MRLRFLLPLVLLLTATMNLRAQNVKFSVNAQEITTDDVLQLSIEVTGINRLASPRFPNIPGFRQAGTSTNQSFGSFGAKATFSASYVPTQIGTFKVPNFNYSAGGKSYTSPPFTITVKKGTGKPKRQQRQSDPFGNFFKSPFDDFFQKPGTQPKPQDFQETKADYFLTVNLNKDTVYVGEQLLGEVALYIHARDRGKVAVDGQAIADMQQRIKNQGFWQETIEFKQYPTEMVQIGGQPFIKYTFYRTVLFPIKTGKIAFKDIYLDAKKLYVAQTNNPFDAFFGNNTKYNPIKIKANERSIFVKPLPETELENANMVGSFRMNAELSDTVLNTGEILEISVKVKGNGNIAMMQEPIVKFDDAFEVDAPTSDYNVYKTETSLYGEKTFTWSMVPTKNGNYNMGPVKFYFFDSEERAYDSLVVDGLQVRVEGEDLENIVLKSSGIDVFYKNGIEKSEDSIRSKPFSGKWALLALTLVVLGSAAYGGARYMKSRPRKEKEEDDGDFFEA